MRTKNNSTTKPFDVFNGSDPITTSASSEATLTPHRLRSIITGSAARPVPTQSDITNRTLLRLDHSHSAIPNSRPQLVKRLRSKFESMRRLKDNQLIYSLDNDNVLEELRDSLGFAETTLQTISHTQSNDSSSLDQAQFLTNRLDDRVERLARRIDRLTRNRNRMYRLAAIFEQIPFGKTPSPEQIARIADSLQADYFDAPDDAVVTLIAPQQRQQSLRITAHVLNVAQVVCSMIEQEHDWYEEINLVLQSAILMDIGMMQLTPEVAHPPGVLDGAQLSWYRNHPLFSRALVERFMPKDDLMLTAIEQHHERLDGTGFPERLRGEQISTLAQLLNVAEAYVELQTPMRTGGQLSHEEALSIISKAAQQGRFNEAWVIRLPERAPEWLVIPPGPEPPAGEESQSVFAA